MASGTHATPDGTRLIGRDVELQALLDAVTGGASLVTVTGPPGIGKSRLVRQLVAELESLPQWSGAIMQLDLSQASSLDEVRSALHSLASPAGGTRGLLVLDGVEHVVGALRQALGEAPGGSGPIVVLASREMLAAEGERCIVLRGLGADAKPDEDIEADPAVTLLCELARAHGVELSHGSARERRTLRELVARLDRNPLALDLAARRLVLMHPEELLARMADRLAIRRSSSAPAAYRTHAMPVLSEAFERSFKLLSDDELSVLAQMAVFSGSAQLDAVEAIVEVSDGNLLDLLEGLVRKSLLEVVQAGGRTARLGLSETMRMLVRLRLEADVPLLAAVTRRHQAVFAARAAVVANQASGGVGAPADIAEALEAMLDVVDWAVHPALRDAARTQSAAALILQFRVFLQHGGRCTGAIERFEAILESRALLTDNLIARLESSLGELLYRAGRGAEAASRLRVALAEARQARDELAEAFVLCALGTSLFYGRADVNRSELERALAVFEAHEAKHDVMLTRMRLARLLEGEDASGEAIALYYELSDASRSNGDVRQLAVTELNLGALLSHLGRQSEAVPTYRKALARTRELGDTVLESVLLLNMAIASFEQHDDVSARSLLERSLALSEGNQYRRASAISHLYLGLLEHIGDRLHEAQLHYAAASAHWAHAWPEPWGQGLLCIGQALVSSALGEAAAARLWLERVMLALEGTPGPGGAALLALAELGATGRELTSLLGRARELAGPVLRALQGRPRMGAPQIRSVLRLFGEAAPEESNKSSLLVQRAGHRFTLPGGTSVDLGRRGPARRLLVRLAQEAARRQGQPLSAQELFEVGWPDTKLLEPHRSNRVYVVVAELRKLGLDRILVNDGDGYRLVGPRVVISDD